MNPNRMAYLLSLYRSRLSIATTLLAICLFPLSAFATDSGTITGRVVNAATGAFLEGAEVSVTGVTQPALTSRDGSFQFRNVSAGAHRVEVFYSGLDVSTKSVQVTPGETTDASVSLSSSIHQLTAYTVTAEREGNAASITRQRTAETIKNVVSTDAFGTVADGNIGNFMLRLPGVTGIVENGEVVAISIRGTPPEMSTVNVDGVVSAGAMAGFIAAGVGDRSTQVDHVPAEFVKEVQVTKAPLPENSADSIGGSANLITKSALDFKSDVFSYRVGSNYNLHRPEQSHFTPSGSVNYLTRLGGRQNMGLALSISYTDTELPRDRVDMQRLEADGRNTQARTLDDNVRRERIGTGARFDFRFDNTATGYAKLQYNYFFITRPGHRPAATVSSRRIADYSRVSRSQIETGTAPRDSANATANVAPGFADDYTEILAATWLNQNTADEMFSKTFIMEVGGEKKFGGDQKLTTQLTYNPSYSNSIVKTFNATLSKPIGMEVDTRRGVENPLFKQTYGPSVAYGSDLSLYTATYAEAYQRVESNVASAKVDYIKPLHLANLPVQLKAGVSWRQQHRWVGPGSGDNGSWRAAGPDGISGTTSGGVNDDNLARFRSPSPAYDVTVHGTSPWAMRLDAFDVSAVTRALHDTPGSFVQTAFANTNFNDITEDVNAGYLQANAQWGHLGIVTGVRYEDTAVSASGRYNDALKPTVTRVTRDRSYGNYFPSIHFRYPIQPNLLARLAISTGASRPNLSDLYPTTTVSYSTTTGLGTISQPDPGLHPEYSKNVDLSLEYYFEPAGTISVGIFRKRITDFLSRNSTIVESGANNGFNGEFSGFTLNGTTNLGSAKVEGLEFNFRKTLVELPSPFNGLTLFANFTTLRTEGTYANGISELANFVPKTGNGGLIYRWRKFQTRVAANYTSDYLRSYNADVLQALRYKPLTSVDISVQYELRPQLSIFLDVTNLNDKWLVWYSGKDPRRVRIVDDFGTRLSVGFSGRF
jgi:iron complex outermembrane receptor protein